MKFSIVSSITLFLAATAAAAPAPAPEPVEASIEARTGRHVHQQQINVFSEPGFRGFKETVKVQINTCTNLPSNVRDYVRSANNFGSYRCKFYHQLDCGGLTQENDSKVVPGVPPVVAYDDSIHTLWGILFVHSRSVICRYAQA
ncbi:hypothetical protein ABW19_dt0208669 [Dactylella cylindrospora]|nr:hypothetical protein ABW19_dt0208669 [Dactylella cylindrospora]